MLNFIFLGCGYCKVFVLIYDKLGVVFVKVDVIIVKVDVDVEKIFGFRFGVSGYLIFKYFFKGSIFVEE